ncbi:hypothetical protein pVco14_003 [Vibrio phage pVco-14]|nr:hypothetical protein pVco14_003 [Vibrio phage pVco-14]
MIVQRTFEHNDPMLWSVAQAEKQNNPICIDGDWLFFKSFEKRGNGVLVNFEKVDANPQSVDETEKRLREALSQLS